MLLQRERGDAVAFISYPEQLAIDAEKRGEERGLAQGELNALKEAIRSTLRLRFKKPGEALAPRLTAGEDKAHLEKVFAGIVLAKTIKDVRKLLSEQEAAP